MGAKILMIEDEFNKNKFAYRYYVDFKKYDVKIASTVKEAVMAIQSGVNYDVILLDIMMPVTAEEKLLLNDDKLEGDGFESGILLITLITKTIPKSEIIVVSAHYMDEKVLNDLGVKGHFVKPTDPEIIAERIDSLIPSPKL